MWIYSSKIEVDEKIPRRRGGNEQEDNGQGSQEGDCIRGLKFLYREIVIFPLCLGSY